MHAIVTRILKLVHKYHQDGREMTFNTTHHARLIPIHLQHSHVIDQYSLTHSPKNTQHDRFKSEGGDISPA